MEKIIDSDFMPNNEEKMTPELAAKRQELKKETQEAKDREAENIGIPLGQLQVEAMENAVDNFRNKEGGLSATSFEELKQIKENIKTTMEDIASKEEDKEKAGDYLQKLQELIDEIEGAKEEKKAQI